MITTNIRWMPLALGALTAISLGVGCSSPGHVKSESKTGQELASNGPTVVDARTQPETIKLNQSLQATEGAEVLADVKDFTAKVTDVKLRFVRVPLEVPMKNIGGTTWRAQLSPQQLKTLAVSGQTMTYEANIVARNEEGQIAVSREPVQVAVTAPDLTKGTG